MSSKTKTLQIFLLSTLLFLIQLNVSSGQTVVKGAYWYWDSGFRASSIDSSLFTHLFCAFADLDPNTYQVTVTSSNSAQFSSFTQTVQQKNPSVKTLLSIGGGGNATIADTFGSMASQPSRRKSFIDSSINLARSYNFHGIDLDWEYPNTTTHMTNFGTLLTELRAAVANESQTSGNTELLLAAAVFRSADYYTINYPIESISNSLNWINVMAYDFYGSAWDSSRASTGPPAALYNAKASQVNGDAGITSWVQAGLGADKIVLGLPFYGYAWRLLNADEHGLFAPADGPADGPAIRTDGSINYKDIRDFISQNGTQTVYNATVVTNYCYSGTTWIGYDDTQSISAKVYMLSKRGFLVTSHGKSVVTTITGSFSNRLVNPK
ncbi:chitotriosidase-1 [Prunus yedoensis var. nudiflora]|uniref:Chitotriosidase-1 n=1 Tax=Prunus yedoensis var. nudiflora TaxID=2094558 RepID=A0A314XI36_PRUYE|nr:chitotriosidase-1 [Prunus yedoensis var. nudiflora]